MPRSQSLPVPPWVHPQGDDFLLDVVVSVRAARTRLMGVYDKRLKLQLAAAPSDGQANYALVRFLAEALQIARAQVEIVAGASNKRKTVRVCAVPLARVLLKLGVG